MARNVFVSFLGTNNYIETMYRLEDSISQPVRFVQEALIDMTCRKWSENDAILIFTTAGSHAKNWVDNGQARATSEIERIGLQSRLESMHILPSITEHIIPEGFTEDDIWSIFDTIFNNLQQNDRIYLDVTHAFRSIPLFAIPLFNFSKFMKSTKLAAIYYGAFESLGSAKEVLEMDVNDRVAPVIELSSLVKLQLTNVAASNFVEFGKVGSLNIESGRSNRWTTDVVEEVKQQLESLDYYILTCDMANLRKGVYYKLIHDSIDDVCNAKNVRVAEKQLLRRILDSLDMYGFTAEASDSNIVGAAKWAINHNMIQQAYTLGEEYMIYRIADYLVDKFDSMVSNQLKGNSVALNEFVGNVLAVPNNKQFRISGNRARVSVSDAKILENYYNSDLRNDPDIQEAKLCFDNIRTTRNGMNHAHGVGKDSLSPTSAMQSLRDSFMRDFDKFIERFPI